MLKNRYFLLSLLLCAHLFSFGQFANDWIQPNQRYFKIKVAEDGLYSIDQATMIAAGIPVNSILANRYQVFRKGEELALNVTRTSANVASKIEFYATKNDGVADTELYRSAEMQPHTYYNLYTDTASYFLTWSLTESGKRMGTKTTLSPTDQSDYHLATDMILETGSYNSGNMYDASNQIQSGMFDIGEGWCGVKVGKGNTKLLTFDIENAVRTASRPSLELQIIGSNNLKHQVVVSVGATQSTLRVIDTLNGFEKREFVTMNYDLNWSDIGESNAYVQLNVLGFAGQQDYISLTYAKLDYPQSFDLPAGENKLYFLPKTGGTARYIRIPTNNKNIRVFDVTDFSNPEIRRTDQNIDASSVYFTIAAEDVDRSLYIVRPGSEISVSSLSECITDVLDPTDAQYFIISHKALMQPASDGVNPVQAYADYRGQEYNVAVAEIQDIYDQFNYGDPSAIAIKNYLRYAYEVGDPQFLLLMGKSTSLDEQYHRSLNPVAPHFLPTYGVPGSDALFSAGLTGHPYSMLPTGRINAFEPDDIKNYLEKVQQMDATGYDNLWRKRIIQLSGGKTTSELSTFRSYILSFQNIAEQDYLGANVFNQSKETVDITFINLSGKVNDGVALITYFGHSASTTSEIELGKISDETLGYSNINKYPVVLMNGCNAGSIFGKEFTDGEDWIRTENRGAIGLIAHSDLVYPGNLRRFATLFYQEAFANLDNIGLGIGEIMRRVQESYINTYGATDLGLSLLYHMVLQGDPAAKIFDASYPDYAITSDLVSAEPIEQDQILASSESYKLNLVVKNFGRTSEDSLTVKIAHTLPAGEVVTTMHTFERVRYQDTLSIELTNDPQYDNEGDHLYQISLDPLDSVRELSEVNNSVAFELFMAKGSTLNLFPENLSVINSNQVKFIWQSADMWTDARDYLLEIDTSKTFNSAFGSSQRINGTLLLNATQNLTQLPDSTIVYWRTKYADPEADEDTTWVQSSFTLIRDGNYGWGQSAFAQMTSNAVTGVELDEVTNRLKFLINSVNIQVNTHGDNNLDNFRYGDFRVIVEGNDLIQTDDNAADAKCDTNTINAVVFHRETAAPYLALPRTIPDWTDPLVCGRRPQFIYNFTHSSVMGANRYLDSLISLMNEGDGLLLFSLDSVTYSLWDDRLKNSLAEVGINRSTINNLEDGQPVVFLGKKGMSEGEAVELVDNGQDVPLRQQSLVFTGVMDGVYTHGTMTSSRIGPAKSWGGIHYDYGNVGDDDVYITVLGLDETRQTETELLNIYGGSFESLEEIDAAAYPYLELKYDFTDQDNQEPSILRHWIVEYDPFAEGVLIPSIREGIELDEGDSVDLDFNYFNISSVDYDDSLDVSYRIVNQTSEEVKLVNEKLAALAAGDSTKFKVKVPTLGMAGANNFNLSVLPQGLEKYTSNNALNAAGFVTVEEDNTNPVLDVTFDGNYILDGDIVSPSPEINILLKDDNQYLFIQDTTGIEIYLKRPCETCEYQRVSLSSPYVSYQEASEDQDFEVTYQPQNLEDGLHELKVQMRDASGNTSGINDYEISFEVINESTITHFYPYPNPFSTSTRFVFTLTGSVLPDKIKIQIMTVSGRIVKEINQDELGQIHIGNNISEYAWDGRDEYGDLLAKGTYFYRVLIEQNDGTSIDHRNTTADRAFKNGFGKLYIIR